MTVTVTVPMAVRTRDRRRRIVYVNVAAVEVRQRRVDHVRAVVRRPCRARACRSRTLTMLTRLARLVGRSGNVVGGQHAGRPPSGRPGRIVGGVPPSSGSRCRRRRIVDGRTRDRHGAESLQRCRRCRSCPDRSRGPPTDRRQRSSSQAAVRQSADAWRPRPSVAFNWAGVPVISQRTAAVGRGCCPTGRRSGTLGADRQGPVDDRGGEPDLPRAFRRVDIGDGHARHNPVRVFVDLHGETARMPGP